MKYIKNVLLLSALLSVSNSFAQTEEQAPHDSTDHPRTTDNGASQIIKSVSPVSPQTAALFRFAEYPVSPATGIPDISIPLFDISLDGIHVPISISYHTSGIKVNDVATPVGLGWVLNAGGVVGRTTNSVPDYATSSHITSASQLNTAQQNNTYGCSVWRQMADGAGSFDTESDRYTYNFAGKTGCFRYDFSSMTIKTIPYVPLKITDLGSLSSGYKIVDSDGAQYYFTQKESTGPNGSMTYSAFYLTKIITPDTKDSIVFTYQTGTQYSQTLVSEYAHKGQKYEWTENGGTVQQIITNEEESQIIKTNINYSIPLISTITWLGNTITFTYDTNRPEYQLQKERLTKITVTNSTGSTIKKIDFVNSGVLGGNTYNKRMLLNSVKIYGSTTDSETYSFGYNTNSLPNYNYANVGSVKCHEDYWGYYNYTSGDNFIPSEYQISSNIPGTNRHPNYVTAQYGILTSITYPTGGKTEFTYEGNVIGNDNWGGLRVKSMIQKEGTTQLSKAVFSYPSGVKSMQLEGLYTWTAPYHYYTLIGTTPYRASSSHIVATSNPILPLTGWNSNPVFYYEVDKVYYDGSNNIEGKKVFNYIEDRDNIGSCGDIENDPLRFYSQLYNCDEGCVSPLLVSEVTYKGNNSSPSQTIQYTYTVDSIPSFSLGVRIYKGDVEIVNGNGITMNDIAPYSSMSEFYSAFHYHDVYGFPSFRKLSSMTTIDHEAGFTTTEEYSYDTQRRTLKPTIVKTATSDGSYLTENYQYPFNYSSQVYQNMLQDNYADRVIQTQVKKGTQVVSTVRDAYTQSGGRYLKSTISSSIGTNSLEARTSITDYNVYGNICGITQDGSYDYAIVWSYYHQYPVAILEGCTYTQLKNAVGTTLLNRLLNAQTPLASDLTALRTAAGNLGALITTYQYAPLAGITEETDAAGVKKSYGYDTLWRLVNEKDPNGNTVKKYTYSLGSSPCYVKMEKMLNTGGTSLSTIEYVDGLGRPVSNVTNSLSSSWVHTIQSYDGLDRVKAKWLPVVSGSQNYQGSASAPSLAQSTYSDNQAYSLFTYDGQSRIIDEETPGAAWKNAAIHKTITYRANTAADAVIKYSSPSDAATTPSANGNYAAGTLMVEISEDEDGRLLSVFKDRQGRTVLERRSTNNDTYFVYNTLGQLRFVVPPLGTSVLYEYRYDYRGRCVKKKLPQCAYIQYWYDSADRMIAMKDGVMDKYRVYFYDKLGRQVLQGLNSSINTSGSFVTAFNSSSSGLANTGYTVSGTTYNNIQLELVNYYDSYAFLTLQSSAVQTNLAAGAQGWSDAVLPNTSNPSGTGQQTGSLIFQMPYNGNYTVSVNYYGFRGRLVQMHSTNHLGGYEKEFFKYSFTDQMTQKKHIHSNGSTSTTELYTNTYNGQDRLSQTDYQLNSNTAITLAKYTYNALGLIGTKKPMDAETVTYGYNVRSWLTGISSTNFTQTLAYNSTVNGLTPNPVYHGGNIAAQRWQSSQDTHSWSFQYGYYQTGFLMDANCFIGTNTYPSFYTEYYYDKMGNLDEVWRTGYISDGVYGRIDDLCPTFDGNRYTRVDDNDYVQNYPYNNGYHFVDNASQDDEYTYDNNGNMTKDLNRFISSIQYNLLNLPQSITYSTNKSATYTYDAAGRKLKTVYTNPSLTIDYCGNMIYEGGTLKQIQVDGGYVTFSGTTPVYHYYLKDHQGNNRVVVNKTGTVEEVNHYYPFGLLFGESINPDTQRFKYNGKELDMMHGLHMYDYGARQYDPLLCRFTTMDPMCEKYYHLSPYAYCGNNPVNAIDMKGDTIIYIYDNTQYNYVMNGNASGFYDKEGNKLNDPNAYEISYALQEIQSGTVGNKLVSFLSNSTKNVSIEIEKNAFFDSNESKIDWNPSDYNAVGIDENGHTETPSYIALAHELFHARDYIMYGNKDMGVWYKNLKGENVSMKEYYTCLNENMIRSERGLPLRKYYADKPYLPSFIPKSVLPFNVLNKVR